LLRGDQSHGVPRGGASLRSRSSPAEHGAAAHRVARAEVRPAARHLVERLDDRGSLRRPRQNPSSAPTPAAEARLRQQRFVAARIRHALPER